MLCNFFLVECLEAVPSRGDGRSHIVVAAVPDRRREEQDADGRHVWPEEVPQLAALRHVVLQGGRLESLHPGHVVCPHPFIPDERDGVRRFCSSHPVRRVRRRGVDRAVERGHTCHAGRAS